MWIYKNIENCVNIKIYVKGIVELIMLLYIMKNINVY